MGRKTDNSRPDPYSLNRVKPSGQLPLFPVRQRQLAITRALNTVSNRYGDFTLTFGSLLKLDGHDGVISPE